MKAKDLDVMTEDEPDHVRALQPWLLNLGTPISASETKVKALRHRIYKAANQTMPCAVVLTVSNFDVYAWSGLTGDLFLKESRIGKPKPRGGVIKQTFVEPNLHELHSFLRFQDFDPEHAHGASIASERSVSFVYKMEATWTHGKSDSLKIRLLIGTVEGYGQVSVDADTDTTRARQCAQLWSSNGLPVAPSPTLPDPCSDARPRPPCVPLRGGVEGGASACNDRVRADCDEAK